MKKIFTVLSVVALTTMISFGQTQYGAVLGLNLANASGSDLPDDATDNRVGIRIGLAFEKELSDVVTLHSGLLYSVKGVAFEQETYNYDAFGNVYAAKVDADQSLNYIEIPVNFGFAVADRFSLMAGFYSGFLVGSTTTIDGESNSSTDGLSAIDFGLGFGAEVTVSDAFSINAGYQMGLAKLDEDGEADVKNTSILIGMTYSFGR